MCNASTTNFVLIYFMKPKILGNNSVFELELKLNLIKSKH